MASSLPNRSSNFSGRQGRGCWLLVVGCWRAEEGSGPKFVSNPLLKSLNGYGPLTSQPEAVGSLDPVSRAQAFAWLRSVLAAIAFICIARTATCLACSGLGA